MLELIAIAIRSSPSFNMMTEDAGIGMLERYVMSRHLAAITVQTMHTPTEAMVESLKPPRVPVDTREYIIRDWHTVIDAILNEKEPA